MKCDLCGKDESLPFVCNYCGGAFCADHRLPEAHQCRGDLTQKRTISAPTTTTFSWQTPSQPSGDAAPRQTRRFSGIELRDIVIAWGALGFAFFLAIDGVQNVLFGGAAGLCVTSGGTVTCLSEQEVLAVALVTVGSGFVLHELSHKFVAQRYGFWAEFRMWPMGIVLALVTAVIGFIFAAPGATYIQAPSITQEENGKISLAGPLVNVAIAAAFLPVWVSAADVFTFFLGLEGVYINVFLAMFNLLPVSLLDGAKVFRWNKGVWLAVMIPLVAAFLFLLTQVF
ncbi:MAG: metalloprotease [Nitrososphaerota archaeon]|nr:metalloprotease [Nitrososphaerota archaeon]